MGIWLTNHASRRPINSANYSGSPRLFSVNAQAESRRGRKDFYYHPWSTSRPQTCETHAIQSERHLRLLNAGFHRRWHEVLGHDGDRYPFLALFIAAKIPLQSTSPLRESLWDFIIIDAIRNRLVLSVALYIYLYEMKPCNMTRKTKHKTKHNRDQID